MPYLVAAVMEPFHKRRQPLPLTLVSRGSLAKGCSALNVRFDAQPLPADLFPGSYFLNGMVLIGEHHLFARRAIQVN